MTWGGEWGDPWGGADSGPLAADLLLSLVRLGPNFRALIDVIEDRHLALQAVMQDMPAAFSLEEAEGVQQDVLGARLGRRRFGASDERYTTLLQIQVQQILSSQSGGDAMVRIVELFTGEDVTEHYSDFPARVSIGGVVAAGDESLLLRILNEAKSGGVELGLHVHQAVGTVLLVQTTSDDVVDPGTIETTLGDEGAAAYPMSAMIEV